MNIISLKVRPNAETSRWIRSPEAAAHISASEWKLRELVEAGELSFVQHQPGGVFLFDRYELDAYMEKKKQRRHPAKSSPDDESAAETNQDHKVYRMKGA